MKPRAIILHAAGINRDLDAHYALEMAGADARIVHVNAVREDRNLLRESSILVVPGGFSYADALGAGRLFALDIASFFRDEILEFVDRGKPVIGICNGFQTLVKSGILPGDDIPGIGARDERWATLTDNEHGKFECRWVTLGVEQSPCIWTQDLPDTFVCPVAHGEGRFLVSEPADLELLAKHGLVALTYALPDRSRADGRYPDNPNGSARDIAGICNMKGNVLGLMPHPEDNVVARAAGMRKGAAGGGLALFRNGVSYAEQI